MKIYYYFDEISKEIFSAYVNQVKQNFNYMIYVECFLTSNPDHEFCHTQYYVSMNLSNMLSIEYESEVIIYELQPVNKW